MWTVSCQFGFIAMKFKDYYQILGVSDSATTDEIKRAYRKKARQYHPDVSKESDAEEKFKSVSEAYEVLKDEKRRAEYDQLKQHGFRGGDDFRRPSGWQGDWNFGRGGHRGSQGNYNRTGQGDFGGNSDFSDFFESIFGQAGFNRGYDSTAQHRPGQHRPNQHGHGQRAGRHSKGDDIQLGVRVSLENAFKGGKTRIKVPAAPGYQEKTLSVNIPSGVISGQQLRLRGQGRPGSINGDLILTIEHKPHDLFEVDGSNVVLTVPVTPLESVEGVTLKVPTLSGRVSLKIPPGTSSGKRLRIKGRGLNDSNAKGQSAGDQIVTVQVVVPDNLDRDSIDQLKKLEAAWEFDPRAHFGQVSEPK